MIIDPSLEHFLEICFSKKFMLDVVEKLEALLIWDLRERVVWLLIANFWV